MTVFKRRSRIISFRVSDEEYATLQRTSERQGAHSVSDYARWAACSTPDVNGLHHELTLSSRVQTLHGRVDELAEDLARLKQVLGLSAGKGMLDGNVA